MPIIRTDLSDIGESGECRICRVTDSTQLSIGVLDIKVSSIFQSAMTAVTSHRRCCDVIKLSNQYWLEQNDVENTILFSLGTRYQIIHGCDAS